VPLLHSGILITSDHVCVPTVHVFVEAALLGMVAFTVIVPEAVALVQPLSLAVYTVYPYVPATAGLPLMVWTSPEVVPLRPDGKVLPLREILVALEAV
jgi:hypothetical protein